MSHNGNHHDQIIKNIGVICLSVIIFALLFKVFAGSGLNSYMGYGQSIGFGIDSLFVALISIVIKLLWLLIVIAFVVSLLLAVQKQNNGYHMRHLCAQCGQELQKGWKHCPACGLTVKKKRIQDKHKHVEIIEEIELTQNTETAATVEEGPKPETDIETTTTKAVTPGPSKRRQDKPRTGKVRKHEKKGGDPNEQMV